MKHQILAPSVGESITEVGILKWHQQDGQAVKTGDLLLEIESDKATVELVAEFSGALTIIRKAGERMPVGDVLGVVDDAVQGKVIVKQAAPAGASVAASASGPTPLSPAVKKAIEERGLDPSQYEGTGKGGRLTKGDLLGEKKSPVGNVSAAVPSVQRALKPGERRVPMSALRTKIAERLVQAQHEAAILTTFNEVDMGPVVVLRTKYKDAFKQKNGVALSFMSFFTVACVEALKAVPAVNACIEGKDVVYHDFIDIGVAVGTERGLVVPVVRGVEKLGFVDVEKKIAELALKARDGKLSIAEMTGGTFTISNGGVYGSLLSTPILNAPQSGILGMHKIQDRPMAINGKVEIRPMMYLALSYDHRLIDGKGAVTFLVALKDFLEHPEKLKLELE
ncbi:2-oxoglutarate dehydrogenase complex dihydrolipoyllysine-residue succinyltransferase [Bdellovibrionota bacterium FG-2]